MTSGEAPGGTRRGTWSSNGRTLSASRSSPPRQDSRGWGLKNADVGRAMGSGTEVARESADACSSAT